MAQQTVTLVSSDKKSGRNNKGEWFFHTFVDAGGNKWQTGFNSPLGEKLADSLGQSVTLEFHEEQRTSDKGTFTNQVIDGADFGGDTAAPPEPTVNAPQASTNTNRRSAPSDQEQASIARSVAFKGAIDLASHGVLDADKDGIIAVAEFFEGYLLTGKVAETVRY